MADERPADPDETPPPPEAPPKEPDMEIHKPKPIHSWRAFLAELGTIVLGICIAISLEQLVESWRWDHEVKNARKAIRAEITANEASFFARRLSFKPCLDRQIREAAAILADLEANQKPRRFTTFHSTNSGPTSAAEWEAQRAAQTLTHFPDDELAMMGRYYGWIFDFKNWSMQEGDRWAELAVLRSPPAGLGPSDFLRLRNSLDSARRYGGLIELNTIRVLNLSGTLGVPRVPVDQERLRLYCNTSDEEYVQRLKDNEMGR